MSVKRTIIIEPGVDPQTGVPYLRFDEAMTRLERLMGTLAEVGGVLRIVADRVKIGELPGEKRPDVLGETVGFIIEYDSVAPLHEESLSSMMLDVATGGEQPPRRAAAPPAPASSEPDESEPELEVPAEGSLAAAVGAATTPEPRFMAGPGGEEEEVPHELWEARLAAGWTFDDDGEEED